MRRTPPHSLPIITVQYTTKDHNKAKEVSTVLAQVPFAGYESGSQTAIRVYNEPPSRLEAHDDDEELTAMSSSSNNDNYPAAEADASSAGNDGEREREEAHHNAMVENTDPPIIRSAENAAAAAGRSSSSIIPPTTFDDPVPPSSPRSSSSNDDVLGDQEILLDAEVEFAVLPPPPPSSSSSLPPRMRRSSPSHEGPILCGVPVARRISADGHVEDAEWNYANNNMENSATQDDGQVTTMESSYSHDHQQDPLSMHHHHPHLPYLGQVVMATMDEGDIEQGHDQADGEESGSLSSQPQQPPSDNLSTPPISKEDHGQDSSLEKYYASGRKGYRWGGVILVVALVALGIVLGTQRRHEDDHGAAESAAQETPHTQANTHGNLFDDTETTATSGQSSYSPTYSPVSLSDQHNTVLQLLHPFLQSTGSNDHKIKGSPQHRAVEWLSSTPNDLIPWMDDDTDGKETTTAVAGLPLSREHEERLIQRYVLAVLYYSTTGGPSPWSKEEEGDFGWKDKSNFLSAAHECEWSSAENPDLGVGCDDDMRVTEIVLANNNLSGTLPPRELHGLSRLRKLDLSRNFDLGGALPRDLGRLSDTLQILALAHNALTGTVPSSYGNLTSLQEFGLDDNKLGGSIPSEVGRMTSLTHIWMHQNDFAEGMENFCRDDIRGTIFYADCFCRPWLEPEVECTCCTICCYEEENSSENCQPNVPCDGG